MGTPTLRRLVDQAALDALLAAATAFAPGLEVSLVDREGTQIAGAIRERGRAGPSPSSPGMATRPLVAAGETLGLVTVRAEDEAVAGAVAELIGRAIELAATEGLGRRAVTAAA
ncbi:MAG TPA: hypothetical protein VE817_07265, partial [Candidatus Acidoferrum sp.]|nr:hypothetical protein [Candidatus Acidoferrum sp.]